VANVGMELQTRSLTEADHQSRVLSNNNEKGFHLLGYNAVYSVEKLPDVSEEHFTSIFRVEE
jgi:hypothetical protein